MARLLMQDVRNAFFKSTTTSGVVKSGNHKVKENRYYYKENCLAELTDTELIINPNNRCWPRGAWGGRHAEALMHSFLRLETNKDSSPWSEDNQYPFIYNDASWGYGYGSATIFSGPLVIDRKTLKIKNVLDSKYVLSKVNKVRNLYKARHMINCCKHFDIEVPSTVVTKLVTRLVRDYWGTELLLAILFKLPLNIDHKQIIKKGLISTIARAESIRTIDRIRSAIEKYFNREDDTDVFGALMPKWVVLHLEGK